MTKVKLFRAVKRTNRFNQNQKVWISFENGNFLNIWYRYRGKGRYVRGIIDRFSPVIGEIKEIDVSDEFAERIRLIP